MIGRVDDRLHASEEPVSQIPIPDQLRVLADELRMSKVTIEDTDFLSDDGDRTDVAFVRDRLIEIAAQLEREGS